MHIAALSSLPRRLRLIALAVLVFGSTSAGKAAEVAIPCAAEPTDMVITSGDIVTCAIDVVGDSDVFRFSGNSGEVVVLTVTDLTINGVFHFPVAQVFTPSMSLLTTIQPRDEGATVPITLMETGTYTVLFSEYQADETESYSVSLHRLFPPPPDAISLCYGCNLTGEIDPIADTDVFVFEGVANETVAWTVTDLTINGVFRFPVAQLFAPSMTLVADNSARDAGSLQQITLPETGTYTVLLSEYRADETEAYKVALRRVFPPPPDAISLCYGCNLTGEIDPIADTDVFVFEGVANDTIIWTVTDLTINGVFRFPVAQLFAPSMSLLSTNSPRDVGSSQQLTLPETGTYTILFSEYRADETESYGVALQCLFGTCLTPPTTSTTTSTSTTSTSTTTTSSTVPIASTTTTTTPPTTSSTTFTSTTSTSSSTSSTSSTTTSSSTSTISSSTSSTAVASSSTTTTTLAPQCPAAATFESIECRLDKLISESDVRAASGLGRFQGGLAAQLVAARRPVLDAASVGRATKAKSLLRGPIRRLLTFSHRLGGNNARKRIPADLRARLRGVADAIRVDVAALRRSL